MIDFVGKKFGNVTIEKPLHKGGYGYSYIGFDESLEKDRVVKVSNPRNDWIQDISPDQRSALYRSQAEEYKLIEYEHNLWEY